MKVAIFTHPQRRNYGGILQCWALQTVLRGYGHEVTVANWGNPLLRPFYEIPISVIGRLRRRLEDPLLEAKTYLYAFPCHNFSKKYINRGKEIKSKEDLNAYLNNDAFITGSDQVWRQLYVADNLLSYFLDFVPDDKIKFSYAASFGVDAKEYDDATAESCGAAIARLDAVSVRESSGINLIENVYSWQTKQRPVHVLDPTLLLRAEDYIKAFGLKQRNSVGIYSYVLDKSATHQAVVSSLKADHKVYEMESCDNHSVKLPAPDKWLEIIRNSDMVITDSFHCCVFSILFHRPFIIVGNDTRGNARLESLLTMLGLQHRIVKSQDDFEHRKAELMQSIDYSKVDVILDAERQKSRNFLTSNLSHHA